MLYEPTQITPSTLTSTGTIAAADNVKIEWRVNGNSAMTAFQIDIYKNDYTSTLVYTTGIITSTSSPSSSLPFYGKDKKGNSVTFTYAPSGVTWGSLGLEDGNEYKYKITQFYTTSNYCAKISLTSKLTEGETYYFSAVVDGTTYYFYFVVTDTDLFSSGAVVYYSVTNSEGFIVSSNMRQSITVGKTTTSPVTWGTTIPTLSSTNKYLWNYEVITYSNGGVMTTEPTVIAIYLDTGGTGGNVASVKEYYLASSNVTGVTTSTSGWSTDTPELTSTNSYLWNYEEITYANGTQLSTNPVVLDTYGNVGNNITSITEYYAISTSNESIMSGTSLGTGTYADSGENATVQNSFSAILARTSPSLTLNSFTTPVTTNSLNVSATYTQGQGDNIKWARWQLASADSDGNIDEDDLIDDTGEVYTSVLDYEHTGLISGKYYALKCLAETENDVQVETEWKVFAVSYGDVSYADEFTVECLKNEDCNLLTWGNSSSDISYFIIARVENDDESTLRIIANVSSEITQLKDFGITSCTAYAYYLYAMSSSGSLVGAAEVEITARQLQRYTLIATEYSEDDEAYHVAKEYQFSANLTAPSISNNNSPSFSDNFTPYPTKFNTSANYASGTLSSLIGYVDYTKNEYVNDTAALQKELFSLSTSNYDFFLKDMKGNLWQVALSAAITQSWVLNTRQQQTTISIPWKEIADASEAAIIQIETDSGWYKDDEVLYVTFDVDVLTGELQVTYPDNYTAKGTTFKLADGDAETETDAILVAETPTGTVAATFTVSTVAEEADDGEITATVDD